MFKCIWLVIALMIGVGIVLFCLDYLIQMDVSAPIRHRKFPLMFVFIGGSEFWQG